MSNDRVLPVAIANEVRDTCLCLYVQRTARALARHFDEAFRPLGLTNGQFSLMMSLNQPNPPVMGEVAALLGLDRTTLTAALKSLRRRRLVEVRADKKDKRRRRLSVTPAGRALLAEAYPLWQAAHAAIDARLASLNPDSFRTGLARLAFDENGGLSLWDGPPLQRGR